MIGKLVNNLTEYIEVKTEQIKLKLIGRVAKLFANLIVLSTLALLAFFMMFFISFALANMLNDYYQNTYIGYWIIASFYLVLMVFIFILLKTKSLQRFFEKVILKMAEKDDE